MENKDLSDLKENAESKVIWEAQEEQIIVRKSGRRNFHIINGKKWYACAADNGKNDSTECMLENKASDPFKGNGSLKGKNRCKTDKWTN